MRRLPPRRFCLLLVAIIALAGPRAASVRSQGTDDGNQGEPPVTLELVQTRLKEVAALVELDEAAKGALRELYQQAIQQLETVESSRAAIADYERQIRTAKDETEAAQKQRAQTPDQDAAAIPSEGLTLVQLEQELAKREEVLEKKREALAKLDAEPKRRAARLAEISGLVGKAQQLLEKTEKELAAKTSDEVPTPAASAKRTLLLARKQAFALTVQNLEKERAAYEATAELLQVQRDNAATEFTRARQEAKQWRDYVNGRRKLEAERQAREAQRKVAEAIPAIAELAKQISTLTGERTAIADRMADASKQLDETRNALNGVKTEFERTKEKIEAIGLSHAGGQILRRQRAALPDIRQRRRNMRDRQPVLRDVRFTIYAYQDRRLELASLDQRIQAIVGQSFVEQLGIDRNQTLRTNVRQLLEQERKYLDDLIADYTAYSKTLLDLNVIEQDLIDTTKKYASFIDERVLWIRSAFALSGRDLNPAGGALIWMGSPTGWADMGRELLDDARAHPLMLAAFLVVFCSVLYSQRRFRVRIRELGVSAARRDFSQILPTFEALALTAIIAVVWPGLLWYLSWRLAISLSPSEFVRSVAAGLMAVASVWFPLELFRQTVRRGGLAEAHFAWPEASLKLVRRHLRWLIPSGLPLVFIAVTTQAQDGEPLWGTSLGRASFIVFLVLVAIFLQRILQPARGVFKHLLAVQRNGWLYRLRYLWFPLAVVSPLLLALLAGAGFYATAQSLAVRLFATACLVFGLVVLGAMLGRWLLMSRRRMAREQARQRREAAAQESTPDEAALSLSAAQEAEKSLDLATVSDQTHRLIRSFLLVLGFLFAWAIWDDVLPALTLAKEIPLWPGATALTLADLFLAGAAILVTYVAARNVPGLLELTILSRLPLDAGARYAVATLCRYLIVVAGVVVAGRTIGITWASIQWLVAAMGIGLGFGLQEIFANFVSGIILLFERPIRVGDIITLGETTGIVTRIRMRATTITDWDRKEFVVPNKDLVTGRLLNWTLTDPMNRIVISVGVAYGSDTERARALLLKVAQDHPRVLDDPLPMATFEGFGDSALNHTLRCYLPSMENRLVTIHELHTAINDAFRAAGIEIAFPQRDLHIRSIEQPLRTVDERIHDNIAVS